MRRYRSILLMSLMFTGTGAIIQLAKYQESNHEEYQTTWNETNQNKPFTDLVYLTFIMFGGWRWHGAYLADLRLPLTYQLVSHEFLNLVPTEYDYKLIIENVSHP